MGLSEFGRVESGAIHEFAQAKRIDTLISDSRHGRRAELNVDVNNAKNGLGRLVLTLVKLLHELLERQAIRRMEAGSLTEQQIERLGLTLMSQAREIGRLRKEFGLEEEDLNLDLGPIGRLL